MIAELGPGPVCLDTTAFIYFIEAHPRFAPVLLPVFQEADRGRREIVTSALTLLEVLVVPYRAGNRALAERYEHLLSRARGLKLAPISMDILRGAAQIRAGTTARTPDAIQLATAIGHGCTSFVTNDRRLPAIQGIRVLNLSNYV